MNSINSLMEGIVREHIEGHHERGLVTTLLGVSSGQYEVRTASGSLYLFDFEARTVERIPGPESPPTINDGIRRLRSIEKCTVGETGYWTMRSDDFMTDWYWQATSIIRSIVAV